VEQPGTGLLGAITGTLGLRDLVPYGPVLTPGQRIALADTPRRAGVAYTRARMGDAPVMPVQVFGVSYDIDLVVVTGHPVWHMHEYARIATPQGPVWLCKDARRVDLEQSIIADIEGIEHWLPEVGVPRKSWPVVAVDRCTEDTIDIELTYENLQQEVVEVRYRGPMPTRLESRRNTSTMGHSRGTVMVALDLSHKAFAREVSMRIGGREQRIDRILGVVPFQLALIQTQAGLSIGRWTQTLQGPIRTTHTSGATQTWSRSEGPDFVELVQHDPLRTLRYRFAAHDGVYELERASCTPWDRGPNCVVSFHPPLPDAARPFEGRFEGRFVLDVNGQASHAVGRVRVSHDNLRTRYQFRPESPFWCVDRPMDAFVTMGEAATVDLHRVDPG
jgi:hypothetical protein